MKCIIYLIFLQYILSLILTNLQLQINAISLGKIQNNILRIYVFSSPRNLRRGFLKNIQNTVHTTYQNVNIIIMDLNSKYYCLSDDDRTIIETIISLTF